jgi:peptidoglycan hydrolase-like protein with peptidoglycan-binding domain
VRRRNYGDSLDDDSVAGRLAGAIGRHPREFVASLAAVAAVFAISFNALFLQNGPHPAPLFAGQPLQATVMPAAPPIPVSAQSAVTPDAATPNRPRLIADIQRELGRRGYYDGAIDGIWGAKTDSATRDFAQAAGLRSSPEISDSLLRAIMASGAKAQTGRSAPVEPVRYDPIAELISPSKRVIAVQRALADFGYGQITPNGNNDADTRAAIEKFERERRLPVTGEISPRVVRELAAMTGRPLE